MNAVEAVNEKVYLYLEGGTSMELFTKLDDVLEAIGWLK